MLWKKCQSQSNHKYILKIWLIIVYKYLKNYIKKECEFSS